MALSSQTRRTLLLAFIGSLALCALMGIYVLLAGTFGWLELRVLATTAAIGGASVLGMASAVAWETRRWYPLGPAGLAVVGLALIALLAIIWEVLPENDDFGRLTASLCVLAVALPHTALLALARLRRQYEWVRYATVGVVGALGALIVWLIWFEPDAGDNMIRAIGTLAILDACGTITVPILHRLSAMEARSRIRTSELEISLTCPRCGQAQRLPVGRSRCACGLRLHIEIEEEHCPRCGYALYRLTSAACPECGEPLAPASQMGAGR